ncbi:GAF domain-containing protein [Actinoplanes campanulatus]|nr:GAF domain-containing protein [Actinoplanes campanulatus]
MPEKLGRALAVVLPMAVFAATFTGGHTRGGIQWIAVGIAALATGSTAWLGIRRELRTGSANRRLNATLQQFAALQPMLDNLKSVSAAVTYSGVVDAEQGLRRQALQMLVDRTGKQVDESTRMRSLFYRWDGTIYRLEQPYAGRRTLRPRETFDPAAEKQAFRSVHDLAAAFESRLLPDVTKADGTHFEQYLNCAYRSVISVAVHHDGVNYGILMIDSDVPDSLTTADLEFAQLVAAAIAAGRSRVEVRAAAGGSLPGP